MVNDAEVAGLAKTQAGLERFERFAAAVEGLVRHFPEIFVLLHPEQSLDTVDGWSAMVQRSEALQAQGRKPVLVATLYGPTGAGKSTLFRLLTGVPVPAGSDVRPVSYASVVVVPPNLDGGPA